jgi:hypothetical protein
MGNAFKTTTSMDIPGQNLNAGSGDAFMRMLTGSGGMNAQNAFGQAFGAIGRSPSDYATLMGTAQPQLSALAGQTADAAMQQYGTDARTLAQQQSQAARQAIESRLARSGLGNYGSGAALGAIARGAAEPLMQAETDIANMRSQAYQNAYNPLAQQLMSGALGQGSQYGNLANTLFAGLAQQSAPEWMAPVYSQTPGWGSQVLGGLVGGLGSAAGGFAGSAQGSSALAKLLGIG